MYIPVYLEIDNDGNPIYKEEFLKRYNNDNIKNIIVSREYFELIDSKKDRKCQLLPSEYIDEIDKGLTDKSYRQKVMCMKGCPDFANWIFDLIKNNTDWTYLELKQMYCDFVDSSIKNGVEIVFTLSTKKKELDIINDLRNKLADSENKCEELQDTINVLHSEITKINESIQRSQTTINSMQNEMFRKDRKIEQIDIEIKGYLERIEKIEKLKQLYLELYKELLVEFDATKIELLNSKVKHK